MESVTSFGRRQAVDSPGATSAVSEEPDITSCTRRVSVDHPSAYSGVEQGGAEIPELW